MGTSAGQQGTISRQEMGLCWLGSWNVGPWLEHEISKISGRVCGTLRGFPPNWGCCVGDLLYCLSSCLPWHGCLWKFPNTSQVLPKQGTQRHGLVRTGQQHGRFVGSLLCCRWGRTAIWRGIYLTRSWGCMISLVCVTLSPLNEVMGLGKWLWGKARTFAGIRPWV